MHFNNKLDEQAIINIIKRHTNAIKNNKSNLSSTTLYLEYQTLSLRIRRTPLKYI